MRAVTAHPERRASEVSAEHPASASRSVGSAQATTGERAFEAVARRLFSDQSASFTVRFPSGYTTRIGGGEPSFHLQVSNAQGLAAVRSLDELRIAEAYMDGHIDIDGDLRQAVAIRAGLNDTNAWITLWRRLQPLVLGLRRCNEQWVQNHYDSNNLHVHFLDAAFQTYTPGVFESEDETLEIASERKHRLAFEGVGLAAGARVLDVGFGWGSFLRYAARRGVHVTGLTLSRHQLEFVKGEIVDKERLPADLVYADFFDYEPREQYDAIIMQGVIEELADYDGVMARVARWLKPGKRVYLDFMAATKDFVFPAFISKYIYQGRTSRVFMPKFVEAVTRSPFEMIAVHNDRRNYYLTCRHWFENFERNAAAIRSRFGERVYRMFRLYLAGNPLMLDHPSHLTTAYRVFLELPVDHACGGTRR